MLKSPLIFLRILTIMLVVIVGFLVKKHHYHITENTVQAAPTCRDIPQNLIITTKEKWGKPPGEVCCDFGEVRVSCSQAPSDNVDRNTFIPLRATPGECCRKHRGEGTVYAVCARLN